LNAKFDVLDGCADEAVGKPRGWSSRNSSELAPDYVFLAFQESSYVNSEPLGTDTS
jgi:hypothetical protein